MKRLEFCDSVVQIIQIRIIRLHIPVNTRWTSGEDTRSVTELRHNRFSFCFISRWDCRLVAPNTQSLFKGPRLLFLPRLTLLDFTVIVSQRNTYIHLMRTKWHRMRCEHRSAWWHRKLWVAVFFIFQGPTKSLMLYADALHCNHRSHWSLLTVFAFYVYKSTFVHKSQAWLFMEHDRA